MQSISFNCINFHNCLEVMYVFHFHHKNNNFLKNAVNLSFTIWYKLDINYSNFIYHSLIMIIRKRNNERNNEAVWLISFFRCYNSSFSFTTNINSRLHFLFYPFFQISEASIIIGIWLHIHIILVKKEWRGFSISKKWAFGGFFLIHLFCCM